MSACQGPAAQFGVPNQGAGLKGFNFGGDFHVTELAKIVIVSHSAGPAQKDVAGGLHDTLALHHPETLMRISALAARRLQDRPACFLDLKEEWIIVIGQRQREITARPDAAHPCLLYTSPFTHFRYIKKIVCSADAAM